MPMPMPMTSNFINFSYSTPGMNQTYYLNSDFVQTYPTLTLLLDLNNPTFSWNLNLNNVSEDDFDLEGLRFDGVISNGTNRHVSFSIEGFSDTWEGSIGIDPNQNFFTSTGSLSPLYFEGDTVAPTAQSIELVAFGSEVFADFTGTGEWFVPSEANDYFLVSFSESVNGAYNSSNYWVSSGYRIDRVIEPIQMTGPNSVWTPPNQVLVEVSAVGTEIPGSVPELGLNSRLNATIEALAVRPTGIETYVSPSGGGTPGMPGGGGTPEYWYQMDLSHDVSKYAFLMQTQVTGAPSYEFWSGAFSLTPNTSGPPYTYPMLKEIAFLQGDDQVDQIFFRTDVSFDPDTMRVNFSAASSTIGDLAGNYLSMHSPGSNDDIVTIDSTTQPSDGTAATIVDSPSSGGFDTLRVELAGDVYVNATDQFVEHRYTKLNDQQGFDFYDFSGSNFSRYEIEADTVIFWGTGGISDVVALYDIGGNEIRLGSSNSDDVVTDIVDYSALSNGIVVNLSNATSTIPGVEVRVIGAPSSTFDMLYGAEGVVGGGGNDALTGNHLDNILIGGNGNDDLDGLHGRDILVGGNGNNDVLKGGSGQDLLIDFDGASMTGGSDDRNPNSPEPKDIFVVRSGSTIEDYITTRPGAGLAGRAVGNINDVIVFNVSLAEIAGQLAIKTPSVQLTSEIMSEIVSNITINVANSDSDSDAYWEVIATSHLGSGENQILIDLGDVEVKAQVQYGQSLTIVPLDDANYFNYPLSGDIYSQKIDPSVLDNLLPVIADSFDGDGSFNLPDGSFNLADGSFNLAFALEATRDGLVRSNGETLMVGDFSKAERIFNPGNASEMIFGSRGVDTYEFLVQNFGTTAPSATPQFVGHDTIRDTGGLDNVLFSGLDRDSISRLNFEAVKVGRERGKFSLKTNYSQSENDITNEGSFTWTGHFREGFDMQLEKITLGNDVLNLAQNIFEYNQFGDLLSDTPIQQALEGEDTIMVGGSGRENADNVFKLKSNGDNSIEQTNLFIWGIDSENDVIDLSEFFISEDDATVVRRDTNDNRKFLVDLDDDDANFELAIHFMGTNTVDSATTLDEMIVRA
jgi:hypothetical protein